MLRYALSCVVLGLCLGLVANAQEGKDKDTADRPKDAMKATVVKVDETGNKITLRFTDKEGKSQERAFDVKDNVKLYGRTGAAAKLNEFKTGGNIYFTQTGDNLTGLWMDSGTTTDKDAKDKKDK